MVRTRLLVVGTRRSGRSVAEAAELSGQLEVVGCLDNALPAGKWVLNVAVLGPKVGIGHHRAAADQTIVVIGNNTIRQNAIQQFAATGFALATVVHPRTIVSSSAVLSEGSAVMAGAIVGTEARLGLGSKVNCGTVVDHHAIVEDFAHPGVNASVAIGTVLVRGAQMQAGAALGYGVSVAPGEVLLPSAAREIK